MAWVSTVHIIWKVDQSHKGLICSSIMCFKVKLAYRLEGTIKESFGGFEATLFKVEKIQEDGLGLIPSTSVKIQIICWKVYFT